jgi:hypothetical protein
MSYDQENLQGYFGECFVRVLASAAGLIAGKQDVDTTGVDFSITSPGTSGTIRFPMIEAQVKTWRSPRGSDEAWHYSMSVPRFNNLAGTDFAVPRFLFLILVPSDVDKYAEVDTTALRLFHCGYWVSLATSNPIAPSFRQSTTVRVPKRNVLTVAALRNLVTPVPLQRTGS